MRPKARFIKQTGGFRLGETPSEFNRRMDEINALERKIRSGRFTASDLDRLRALKGLPPDEWDFDEEGD